MDLKILILIIGAIGLVSCQHDAQLINLINSTQHLQDIERGGRLYPILNPTDVNSNLIPRDPKSPIDVNLNDITKPQNTTRYPNFNHFLNETRKKMPSGICIKEVA
jgi:hypothetical protein